MRRVVILGVLVAALASLLLANVFRYREISRANDTITYVDTWTGNKWIKVQHNLGTDRIAAKFISEDNKRYIDSKYIVDELRKMRSRETAYTTGWWTITGMILAFIVYNIIVISKRRSIILRSSK